MAEGESDGVRDEFLAEAQEIVESLSRDLLVLDQGQKEGHPDPDLVNEVFRGVHTLKGIAGMFGYHQVGAVAHALEDLLDDLRLGRVDLSQDVLDVLFEGVENFQRLLGEAREPGGEGEVDLSGYAQQIERVSAAQKGPATSLDDYDIDPGVLAVLTEYEEHRLRTNVEQGVPLFRLSIRLSLASIDTALETLKSTAKPLGEIITYLPSMGESDGDAIDLEVLLASRVGLERLVEVLGAEGTRIEPVGRRSGSETVPPFEMPRAPTSVPPPQTRAIQIPSPPPPPRPGSEAPRGSRAPRSSQAPRPRTAKMSQASRAGHVTSRPPPVVTTAEYHEEPGDEPGDALSLRSVTNTVRVDIRKLDHLMNVVGELAIVRSAVARINERIRGRTELRALAAELHRVNRGFERHLTELQEGILDVRMVPLRHVFDRLARVVRQVAREHEKEIRLVVTGAETEVDKLIVEELSDPLMHIIRNAIDHGVEKPKMRELSGKPTIGTLALNAYQKGNQVVLEVEDDGAGMSDEKLFETAVRRGLVDPDARAELSRHEILNLIFVPGFTTRSAITDTSGRGVGMDVVKTNINRLGGIVDVQSEHGTGTKFTITLPITLAIIRALIVDVCGRIFCVPLTSVQEVLMYDPHAVRSVEGREVMTLRGGTLPLCRLGGLFRFAERVPPPPKQYVVVTSVGPKRMGFVADALHGQQDIVIKALGRSLSKVRGFAGATDLGDQRVALVLDAPALMEEALAGTEHALAAGMRS
jgi:two-component system chemotaxis sensor kinase CheA